MTTAPTLFVTGASGHLGRLVVEALLERGYGGKIIAGSRDPAALNFAGVEARKADFGDLDGFTRALAGVDRLLIVSVDALGEERRRLQGNAVAAAKAAGVKRIVYTSMPHPDPGNATPMADGHFYTERLIEETGIDYTILRMSWYAENLMGALPQAIASGKWFTASGKGLLSHLPRIDVARAAAGALLAEDAGSRVLTVSGTAAFTVDQIAAMASEITGKPIEVVHVDDEGYRAGLLQAGLPPHVADIVGAIDKMQREGGLSMVTNAMEELWGAPPQDLRGYLEDNKAALAGA